MSEIWILKSWQFYEFRFFFGTLAQPRQDLSSRSLAKPRLRDLMSRPRV